MSRNLVTKTVRRFRGLNLWDTASNLGPEWAQDCLNVIPNSSGGISKLRAPTALSAYIADLFGNGNIVNFQNALDVRQVIVMVGDHVYRFSLDGYGSALIDSDSLNNAVASFVQSNNILFVANGLRMMKWTGSAWQKWGIDKPETAPVISEADSLGVDDPNEAPVLDITGGWFSLINLTFTAVYTFVDANGGETLPSPAGGPLTDTFFERRKLVYNPMVTGSGPYVMPENAVGWNCYVDLNGGTDYHKVNNNPITGNVLIQSNAVAWAIKMVTGDPPPIENTTGAGRTFATGRKYKYAYANSVTGHVGPASEESESTGEIPTPTNILVNIPNPEDDQCDSIVLFATEDGGADFYMHPNPGTDTGWWPVNPNPEMPEITVINDGASDDALDHTVAAPLINYPPPASDIAAKFQGRIFVADGQDICYSGYERIFIGRPEESFPPRNRLRLAIGADEIRGIGAMRDGIVAWSRSNEMFVFRGAVEDITVDAPIQYSAVLDQLPYSEGCASHHSIAETPHGIVWLGSDKTVKVWNGQEPPMTLSGNLYPLLRRITAGQEGNCRGEYFSWLEKKWYLLCIPIDGSVSLNRILVIDLEPDAKKNAGAFVFSVGNIHGIDIVEDGAGKRQVVFLQDGILRLLPTDSATTHGISS